MQTRADLQPWIEEIASTVRATPGFAPSYLEGMKASLMNRYTESLADFALSYAKAHGEDVDKIVAACREITTTKGEGYAGSEDFLANFYRVGKREGIHAISALAVYVWKHIDWIDTFERTGVQHGSEGLASRIGDIVLYAALGRAIQIREANKR